MQLRIRNRVKRGERTSSRVLICREHSAGRHQPLPQNTSSLPILPNIVFDGVPPPLRSPCCLRRCRRRRRCYRHRDRRPATLPLAASLESSRDSIHDPRNRFSVHLSIVGTKASRRDHRDRGSRPREEGRERERERERSDSMRDRQENPTYFPIINLISDRDAIRTDCCGWLKYNFISRAKITERQGES